MIPEKHLILTAPPDSWQAAAANGLPVAHIAYRIGSGGHLLRAQLPLGLRGGLMAVGDAEFDGTGDVSLFCREVVRECASRRFDGVLCDFEKADVKFLRQAVSSLSPLLRQRGWKLYVTWDYGDASDYACVLFPSALCAGSFEEALGAAVKRYSPDRVALAAELMAREFPLPAAGGDGTPLDREALSAAIRRLSPAVYFDRRLCSHYFTYMTRAGARYVVFDDGGSLQKKVALAQSLGVSTVFVPYPAMESLLPALMGQ